ncbi:DNA polymerase domain-containing protein [Halomontanus rarus]|uniref:DNA polymerase domain-containing protein n=1 Tax=Halomontanus rarus TaxID=3034020 RepID=UPI0023E79C63|nr:DNA polymerase domain-containing protein [Halovivax sp. TS33]
MTYTFEFDDGSVRAWNLTADGAESECVEYTPSLVVDGPATALESLADRLASDPKVRTTEFERRYTSLHDTKSDRSRVLRVSLERLAEVRTLADEIRGVHERECEATAPGTYRLYDVDLAPGFRYCLDEGIDPTPVRELRTLRIGIDDRSLANRSLSELRLDGEPVDGEPAELCWSLRRRLEREDPDVLVVSHGELIPFLETAATEAGLDGFHLGRLPGSTRVAGSNTYESYGQVGHSPARYRVPGRAIVDESNSFLWHQSGLEGLVYMVRRTGRPLQEAAWGSIGTLLTSRQIRLAREQDVLAPWNKWEPESFSDVETLHAADRGGFTFAPEVGLHENVHEIDFASLYPRIICQHNVSPETVGCACCAGDDGRIRERVPELEYHICREDGFLPGVLRPLLDDRAKFKRKLREDPDEAEERRLRAKSGAIKWILVSCFGYQGYRNAKYGRIECHEAINAYAREIMLRSKHFLESAGWHIVHGIVDSLWVTPRGRDDRQTETEPEALETVLERISCEIGIELEHDGAYEWVCFVPLRGSESGSGSGSGSCSGGRGGRQPGTEAPAGALSSAPAGALTRYFGKRTSGGFKCRGIECRQRSTSAFVADCQHEFLEVLDETRDPEAVCDQLGRRLGELRRSDVDPSDLVLTKRVSQPVDAYRQRTHTVAALRRYDRHDIERHPGQTVRYIVVDDDARNPERVRLEFELEPDPESESESDSSPTYDSDYYANRLVRAAESVTSPLGWGRTRIRRYLADGRTVQLSTFRRR